MNLLTSLLPALVPSWRFFDRVGPAPVVEWRLASAADADANAAGSAGRPAEAIAWRPVSPRPAHVPFAVACARLFWNPRRNESLFLVSCAERLLDDPSPARADLLWTRVADIVRREHQAEVVAETAGAMLRVRIVEVTREEDRLVRDVMYVSEVRPL